MEKAPHGESLINFNGKYEDGFFIVTCNMLNDRKTEYEVKKVPDNCEWVEAYKRAIAFTRIRKLCCYTLGEFVLITEVCFQVILDIKVEVKNFLKTI